jgi:hypothetical protein
MASATMMKAWNACKILTISTLQVPHSLSVQRRSWSTTWQSSLEWGLPKQELTSFENIDQGDWQYYSFRPGMGIELQYAADNMYEAVFVKNPQVERWQQVFQVYSELNEFRTKDLFARHFKKADRWASPTLLRFLSLRLYANPALREPRNTWAARMI